MNDMCRAEIVRHNFPLTEDIIDDILYMEF